LIANQQTIYIISLAFMWFILSYLFFLDCVCLLAPVCSNFLGCVSFSSCVSFPARVSFLASFFSGCVVFANSSAISRRVALSSSSLITYYKAYISVHATVKTKKPVVHQLDHKSVQINDWTILIEHTPTVYADKILSNRTVTTTVLRFQF